MIFPGLIQEEVLACSKLPVLPIDRCYSFHLEVPCSKHFEEHSARRCRVGALRRDGILIHAQAV